MPTLEELQAALDKANSEAAAHRKGKAEERERAEALQKQLDDIAAKVKKAEDDKLIAENKHEELFKRKEAELVGSLDKVKSTAEQWQKRYEQLAIDGQIISAAAKNNAHDPSLISKLLRDQIALDEKGEVYVKAGDGVAMNEKGERIGVESLTQSYLNANPYLVKPTGAGSGSQGSKGTDTKQTMKRADFESKSPADQAAFIRGGGKLSE